MEHTPARAERAVQSTCHGLLCRTSMLFTLGVDALYFSFLCLRPSPALAAENLFLRKQLTLYQERNVKPRCLHTPT